MPFGLRGLLDTDLVILGDGEQKRALQAMLEDGKQEGYTSCQGALQAKGPRPGYTGTG